MAHNAPRARAWILRACAKPMKRLPNPPSHTPCARRQAKNAVIGGVQLQEKISRRAMRRKDWSAGPHCRMRRLTKGNNESADDQQDGRGRAVSIVGFGIVDRDRFVSSRWNDGDSCEMQHSGVFGAGSPQLWGGHVALRAHIIDAIFAIL